MKNKNLLIRLGIALLTGITMVVVYSAGYSRGSGMTPTAPETVSLQDARRYANQYLASNPASLNNVVKAIVVDIDQYQAMSQILNQNSGTTAFRIYYGIDDNNKSVRMVVGIKSDGRDNTASIYATNAWMSGICPPICDEAGSLNQN